MKSSCKTLIAVGVLALAATQASASSISVYEGMSPVTLETYKVNSPQFDPMFFELNTTAVDTGMLTRLIDTTPDTDPLPSWTVTYEIFKDTVAGAGYSLGASIDSFLFTDATYSNTSPSPWHFTNLALAGEYVLKISTNGASSSASQISAVPLPGAALLFGSALLGMAGLRRKQKADMAAA